MKASSRHNSHVLCTVLYVIVGLLLVAPAGISAGEWNKPLYHKSLKFSGGIELARRDMVRELYGTAITVMAGFEHRLTPYWGWEADLKVRYSAKGILGTDFLTVSLTPMATRTLAEGSLLRFSAAAGPGLGYRVIWVKVMRIDETGQTLGQMRVHQNEIDLFAQAAVSLEWKLGRVGVVQRVAFDRWLTGHPSTGDFGDTGGFNFLVGIGSLL